MACGCGDRCYHCDAEAGRVHVPPVPQCACGKPATTLYTLRRPDGTLAGQIRTCDSCPVINLEWTKEAL